MKIVDITTFFSTAGSGVTTYLKHKARLFSQIGQIDYRLILPGPRDEVGELNGSPVFWVKSRVMRWSPHYRYLVNFWKIFRILKQQKPDLVEVEDPYWIPLFLVLMRPFLSKVRLLVFYRADFPDTYVFPFFMKRLPLVAKVAQRLSWWYVRTLFNRFDGVLVHSEVMGQKLQSHGIQTTMHVVGNLTNMEAFVGYRGEDQADAKLQSRFGKTGKRLLYCGRLSIEKGIDLLLETFSRLRCQWPDMVLLIVGSGPMQKRVMTLANNEEQRIFYIPSTSDVGFLASLFAFSDVLVVPSPHETFSMVALEAMASGLPVAGVRGTGGLRALVQPGVGFLSETATPLDLKLAINRALEPKESWYCETVQRTIVDQYRHQQVYDNLLAAYRAGQES